MYIYNGRVCCKFSSFSPLQLLWNLAENCPKSATISYRQPLYATKQNFR